jgi:hypothetical protein
MTNLLQETRLALTEQGKAPADVRWVGQTREAGSSASWEEFVAIADFDYDAEFYDPIIAADLVVVGDDWWLAREDFCGLEWWAFKEAPAMPLNPGVLLTENLRE